MSEKKKFQEKVMSPEFRVSFPNVFKPKAPDFKDRKNDEAVYSITMLFPKEKGIKVIQDAAKRVAMESFGSLKGLRLPWKDGDEKTSKLESYKGHWFINSYSKYKPGLIDANGIDILNPQDFYAGCWARATLMVSAYNTAGNKGISCYLQNLQKLRDDVAFSGRKNAKDDFGVASEADGDEGWESDDDVEF